MASSLRRHQKRLMGTALFVVVATCAVISVSSFSTVPCNQMTMTCRKSSELSMGMLGRIGRRPRRFSFRKKELNVGKSGMVSTVPVMVKPRPMVTVSAETGEFINVQPARRNNEAKPKRGSKWNAFKQSVYNAADGISSIPNMFRSKESREPQRPIQVYGDTVERVIRPYSPVVGDTPGQRLMQQLESNPRAFAEEAVQSEKKSAWDNLKSGVYGTLDGVTGLLSKDEKPATPPIVSLRTVPQESISSSATVRKAIPDLTSANPIQKLRAENAIREWENKQLGVDQEDFVAEFKETVYSIIDAIGNVFEAIASIPDKAVETANAAQQFAVSSVDFVTSIPKKVEEFVQGIKSFANQVQQSVLDAKRNIDNGVKVSKAVVEDVQALPQTVSQSVEDAKRSVIETQQALEDAVHNVKVLVGAEKPKPKPPKQPPPMTSKDIAWKVAGGVAKGSAKAAWFVGKGAVSLGIKGAQFLLAKASEKEETKGAIGTVLATPPPISKEEQAELNREVVEAMQLAAEALKLADEEKTSTAELEGAVQRAREAAIKATSEARKMEEKLKEEETKIEESESSSSRK